LGQTLFLEIWGRVLHIKGWELFGEKKVIQGLIRALGGKKTRGWFWEYQREYIVGEETQRDPKGNWGGALISPKVF